jgi:hypothetical protein
VADLRDVLKVGVALPLTRVWPDLGANFIQEVASFSREAVRRALLQIF